MRIESLIAILIVVCLIVIYGAYTMFSKDEWWLDSTKPPEEDE